LEAETMTVAITWKDFYSVGDPLLDTQHKQIIDAINQLYEAMQNNSSEEVIKPILDRLVQYTFNHFKCEEETLQAIRYPDYLEHKTIHDKMRKQTFDLKKNADLVTGNKLLKILKEWWVGHIQSEDKKYKPYLELTESHR
jgi:hemerythrin